MVDASGLPGKWLEIQILRPHFKAIESEILGMGPSNLHFYKPFRCFRCMHVSDDPRELGSLPTK